MLADVINEIDQGEEEDSDKTLNDDSINKTNKNNLTRRRSPETDRKV